MIHVENDIIRLALIRQTLTDAEQANHHTDWGMEADLRFLLGEYDRQYALLNSPETRDFLNGVQLEAAHQRARWGAPHDREKSAEHWYWLVGYLAGKALRSAITGDVEKARHHTISSAAALLHWHTAITEDETGCGLGRDADLQAHDDGRQAHETAPVRP